MGQSTLYALLDESLTQTLKVEFNLTHSKVDIGYPKINSIISPCKSEKILDYNIDRISSTLSVYSSVPFLKILTNSFGKPA